MLHLGRLPPNVGEPKLLKYVDYENILKSIVLYGVPLLTLHIKNVNVMILSRIQRLMSIRVAPAYRKIPSEIALLLGGSFALAAQRNAEVYGNVATEKERQHGDQSGGVRQIHAPTLEISRNTLAAKRSTCRNMVSAILTWEV